MPIYEYKRIMDNDPIKSQRIKTIDDLLKVRKDLGDCRRCQLSQERTNIVFGEGNPFSELMFVGEGPGQREDELGRPFVGRSGELLDAGLKHNELTREDVYITNIVKCRPPDNRNPAFREMGTCTPFLYDQIRAIQPKCIITLGKVPAEYLTGQKISITKESGTIKKSPVFPDIFIIPILHPAYILRNHSNTLRNQFFHDIGWASDVASFGLTPAEFEEAVYEDWMTANDEYYERQRRLWRQHRS